MLHKCICVLITLPIIFRMSFGMHKPSFLRIFEEIQDDITREENETVHAFPPLLRFVIFMQYVRTNSFHRAVATQTSVGASRSAVTKTIANVAAILAKRLQKVYF
jgi:hypothetical protein